MIFSHYLDRLVHNSQNALATHKNFQVSRLGGNFVIVKLSDMMYVTQKLFQIIHVKVTDMNHLCFTLKAPKLHSAHISLSGLTIIILLRLQFFAVGDCLDIYIPENNGNEHCHDCRAFLQEKFK